ncbi:MAG: hypothetical protein H8E44_12475 [Planctomycetes bacterium]|nr:hypothetical protein [Planctomycetota bacterium]MBL7041770.1 hypothetical protein [Pirellulaceae bacterium]
MSIQTRQQLENTQKKLRLLEERCQELDTEPAANPHVRELTRRSLRKLINQMKEEVACFESRSPAPVSKG